MKENFNIDELFKQKFDNFQPDVDPSVWANIQAGIGAGATGAAAGGISAAVKIGLISGGIIAASVATWYFGFYEPAAETAQNTTQQTLISEPVQNPDETTNVVVSTLPNEDETNTQPVENHSSHQQSPHVSQQNGTPSNGGNSQTSGNTTTGSGVTNAGNTGGSQTTVTPNNQSTNTSQSGNTTNPDDRHKELLPTGRMEYTQVSAYAPSQVTFASNARNFEEVHWDFGDGTVAQGTDVKHAYTKPGKYEVRMTVVGEKTTYEESQEVVVKSKSSIDNVPNVITPDGDRINDYFSIKSTDIETFYITITDKNGKELFTSTDKDFVWDGTDPSGEVVAKGSYTYVIIAEGKDGSVIKLPGQIYVQ